MGLKITGKLPSGELLKKLKQSSNFKGKAFQNVLDTAMMADDASYWTLMRDYFRKHPNTKPPGALPSVITDLKHIAGEKPVIVWFGHSSYFIRLHGKNILVDPVFSGHAAPVSFMVKAFPGSDVYAVDHFPAIDYLILTHDHYDHLDYKTIRQLKSRVDRIFCSLGVSSHLIYWGIDKGRITELDWWESAKADDNIEIVAAPARHFSGRGLKRGQTFWSSFILKTRDYCLYLGGDSGYDTHFKIIGEKYGPFDLVILESGQYNTMWPLIHMMPEQTVQAAVDLRASVLMPVHWGKFMLAMHEWNEPVKRILKKAKELNVKVTTPKIGEPVIINESYPAEEWWDFVPA